MCRDRDNRESLACLTKGGKTMRNLFIGLSTVCAMAFLALAGATDARAQNIIGSLHDFQGGPRAGDLAITGTGSTEICVFCHVPHNGRTFADAEAPLWNRTGTLVGAPFTPYTSPTIDSDGGTIGQPQGVSLACLSCHDGVTAIDALITGDIAVSVNGSANGTLADFTTASTAILGSDLTNDHPVSFTYPTPAQDPDFVLEASLTLPLFGTGADQVECASCHAVHDDTNVPFLRVDNVNSDLCQDCHQK
jgi:predicted CXXCH cytochrome family protein